MLYDLAVRIVEYVVVLMLMVKYMLRALQKTDQVLAVRWELCVSFFVRAPALPLHRPEVKGRVFTPMGALNVASAGTRLGSHVRREFCPSHQVAAVWVWLWCG